MSYSEFSTENADYYLVYGIHTRSNIEPIFEPERIRNLDAIVLENAVEPTLEKINITWLADCVPYKEILSNVTDAKLRYGKSIPVYFGDCDPGFIRSLLLEEGVSAAELLSGYFFLSKIAERLGIKKDFGLIISAAIVFGLKFLPIPYSLPRGRTDSPLTKIVAEAEYLIPTTLEFRNALIAAKVDEYLAPKLNEHLQKKPGIAIVYGAGHAGIKEDIISKKRRDLILELYRKIGYFGMEKSSLDNLVGFSLDEDNEWKGKEYKTCLLE